MNIEKRIVQPSLKVHFEGNTKPLYDIYEQYSTTSFAEDTALWEKTLSGIPDGSPVLFESIVNGLFVGRLQRPILYAVKAMSVVLTIEDCRRVVPTSEGFNVDAFVAGEYGLEECIISRPVGKMSLSGQFGPCRKMKENTYDRILEAYKHQRELRASDFPPMSLTCEAESLNGYQIVSVEGQNIIIEHEHGGKYAFGQLVHSDFSMTPVFVSKVKGWFAYGDTLKEAHQVAMLYSHQGLVTFRQKVGFMKQHCGGLDQQMPVYMLVQAFVVLGGISHKMMLSYLESRGIWTGGFLSIGRFMEIMSEAGDTRISNLVQAINYEYDR